MNYYQQFEKETPCLNNGDCTNCELQRKWRSECSRYYQYYTRLEKRLEKAEKVIRWYSKDDNLINSNTIDLTKKAYDYLRSKQ